MRLLRRRILWAYARAVLGDVKFETRNNADRDAQPGHGLGPKIEQDRQHGITALSSLVNGNASPNQDELADELAKVSVPGTQLNRDVVEMIRRLLPQERAVVVGKPAAERATAANVERAMMLRRLLHPLPGATCLCLRRRAGNPAHGGGRRPGNRPDTLRDLRPQGTVRQHRRVWTIGGVKGCADLQKMSGGVTNSALLHYRVWFDWASNALSRSISACADCSRCKAASLSRNADSLSCKAACFSNRSRSKSC
jgi:hypothetical protein